MLKDSNLRFSDLLLFSVDIAKEEEELRRQNELSEKQIQQIENEVRFLKFSFKMYLF